MNRRPTIGALAVLVLAMVGCASSPHARVFEPSSAVELRSYQTRAFDTTDRHQTLRTVIAALQDLGFVIDKADATLGTVTATRYDRYVMRMTVTVRAREGGRVAVRANARIDEHAVTDPSTYQDFFTVLDKAMFLTLHDVD